MNPVFPVAISTTIAAAAKPFVTHALAALVGLPSAAGFVSKSLIVADAMLLMGPGFIGVKTSWWLALHVDAGASLRMLWLRFVAIILAGL